MTTISFTPLEALEVEYENAYINKLLSSHVSVRYVIALAYVGSESVEGSTI